MAVAQARDVGDNASVVVRNLFAWRDGMRLRIAATDGKHLAEHSIALRENEAEPFICEGYRVAQVKDVKTVNVGRVALADGWDGGVMIAWNRGTEPALRRILKAPSRKALFGVDSVHIGPGGIVARDTGRTMSARVGAFKAGNYPRYTRAIEGAGDLPPFYGVDPAYLAKLGTLMGFDTRLPHGRALLVRANGDRRGLIYEPASQPDVWHRLVLIMPISLPGHVATKD